MGLLLHGGEKSNKKATLARKNTKQAIQLYDLKRAIGLVRVTA
jgi:hypothetical protein